MKMGSLIYTIEEAAAILKVPEQIVHMEIDAHQLACVLIGEKLRIRGSDLEKYVFNRTPINM